MTSLAFSSFAMTQPSKLSPRLKLCLWFTAAYLGAAAVAPLFGQKPTDFAVLVTCVPLFLAIFVAFVVLVVGIFR
jgi:hypothetical protein